MEHVKHSTSNRVLIGDGMYVEDMHSTFTQYEDKTYGWVSYWKASPQELEILNSNGLVRLDVLVGAMPASPAPVAINVTEVL